MTAVPTLTPPGYPICYTKQTIVLNCGGCGTETRSVRFLTTYRTTETAHNGQLVPRSETRPLGLSERVYSGVRCDEVTMRQGTPMCDRCSDFVLSAAEPVPQMPAPTHRLNWLGGRTSSAGEAGDRPRKAKTLDDILL